VEILPIRIGSSHRDLQKSSLLLPWAHACGEARARARAKARARMVRPWVEHGPLKTIQHIPKLGILFACKHGLIPKT